MVKAVAGRTEDARMRPPGSNGSCQTEAEAEVPRQPHPCNAPRSTSPNSAISSASWNTPVPGSPVRENATAPACLPTRAWARRRAAPALGE